MPAMSPIQPLPFIRMVSWSQRTRVLRIYLSDARLVGHKFSLDISGSFVSLDEITEAEYRYKTHFTVGRRSNGDETGIIIATLNPSKHSFNPNCQSWQYGKRFSKEPVPTSSCHLNGPMHVFQFEAPTEFALGGDKAVNTTDIPEASEDWFRRAKLKQPKLQRDERGSITVSQAPANVSDEFVRRTLSQIRLIEANTDYRLEKKLGNWRFIKGAIE